MRSLLKVSVLCLLVLTAWPLYAKDWSIGLDLLSLSQVGENQPIGTLLHFNQSIQQLPDNSVKLNYGGRNQPVLMPLNRALNFRLNVNWKFLRFSYTAFNAHGSVQGTIVTPASDPLHSDDTLWFWLDHGFTGLTDERTPSGISDINYYGADKENLKSFDVFFRSNMILGLKVGTYNFRRNSGFKTEAFVARYFGTLNHVPVNFLNQVSLSDVSSSHGSFIGPTVGFCTTDGGNNLDLCFKQSVLFVRSHQNLLFTDQDNIQYAVGPLQGPFQVSPYLLLQGTFPYSHRHNAIAPVSEFTGSWQKNFKHFSLGFTSYIAAYFNLPAEVQLKIPGAWTVTSMHLQQQNKTLIIAGFGPTIKF